MPTIRIRGHAVDVDVRAEIERFSWEKARWTSDKLIAASPFRYDRSPSFFVNLEGEYAGTWGDSGYYDIEWKSGGLVKLLAFLENCTTEEVEERLLAEYGREWSYGERIEMPKLSLKQKIDRHLPIDVLDQYKFRHPYLERNRGINEQTQRKMRIGYCKKSKAVTIPWFSADGRLANIKYRKVYGKVFWYEKGAVPVRNLVYGIDLVYRLKAEKVYLCEAEIDAMTIMTAIPGAVAVALGGANFTKTQANTLKRSSIKELTICSDNDKTGEKLKKQVIDNLRGYVELSEVKLPTRYKDVNEAHLQGNITSYFEKSVKIRQIMI